MAELKLEDAKKELEGMVSKQKVTLEKAKETQMTEEQKKLVESEKKKAEELRLQKEAQAKKDAEILTKKPEELSEDEKKRKGELLEIQRKEEEAKLSSEDKIKKIKEESQKRVDEIKNELLQTKDLTTKQIEELRKELDLIKKRNEELEKSLGRPKDDEQEIISLIEKEEKERLDKYLQEDGKLPREKRKEMTDEELEEWLLEDLKAATAWLSKRELRRERERQTSLNKITQERSIKKFLDVQAESSKRVEVKYPELNTLKREDELKAQGKTREEIHRILSQENEKYRLCSEILKENPELYLIAPNGPELVVAEMEKRLSGKTSTNKEVEELRKQVEDLTAQLAKLQSTDTGVNSTVQRTREEQQKLTDQENQLVQTMKDLNLPQDKIDSALKKFREKSKK